MNFFFRKLKVMFYLFRNLLLRLRWRIGRKKHSLREPVPLVNPEGNLGVTGASDGIIGS